MSRLPLTPLPSLDMELNEAFALAGLDMETDSFPRRRFRELVPDDDAVLESVDQLIPTLETAQLIHAALEAPDDWEIVRISRSRQATEATLGFDIGWWQDNFYSIVCDSAVFPVWHGPDPADFGPLGEWLSQLNEHLLFRSACEAEEFRGFYERRSWAERDGFVPIRVDASRFSYEPGGRAGPPMAA